MTCKYNWPIRKRSAMLTNYVNYLGSGKQGFQTPIANDSFIVDGVGALGNTHTERGLTYFEVQLSGHM